MHTNASVLQEGHLALYAPGLQQNCGAAFTQYYTHVFKINADLCQKENSRLKYTKNAYMKISWANGAPIVAHFSCRLRGYINNPEGSLI